MFRTSVGSVAINCKASNQTLVKRNYVVYLAFEYRSTRGRGGSFHSFQKVGICRFRVSTLLLYQQNKSNLLSLSISLRTVQTVYWQTLQAYSLAIFANPLFRISNLFYLELGSAKSHLPSLVCPALTSKIKPPNETSALIPEEYLIQL